MTRCARERVPPRSQCRPKSPAWRLRARKTSGAGGGSKRPGASWATVAVARRNPASLARFHRFSVAVWLFWLVPYVCGMLMGMPAAHATTGGALAVSAAVSVR